MGLGVGAAWAAYQHKAPPQLKEVGGTISGQTPCEGGGPAMGRPLLVGGQERRATLVGCPGCWA